MEGLPTDSISFGRFELESLSWERRSSFSHNRYLDEVQKYSTPGSVTLKKAYFEAHFKRKALLRQASTECQNGIECTANEKDILDHMICIENFEEHGLDDALCARFDDIPNSSHEDNFLRFSNAHGCEVECENEDDDSMRTPPLVFQMDSIPSNNDLMLEDEILQALPCGILQTQSGCETQVPIKDCSELETEQKMGHESENMELIEKTDDSKKSLKALRGPSRNQTKQKEPSPKVKVTSKQKANEPKLRTQISVTQIPQKVLDNKASVDATPVRVVTRTPKNMGRESPLRKKPEGPAMDMKSRGLANLTTFKLSERKLHSYSSDTERRVSTSEINREKPKMLSVQKDMKLEGSEHVKPKSSQETRRYNRNKDEKEKKATDIHPPAPEKGEVEVIRSAIRSKRITTSVREDSKANTALFNFKSDERADKRKEFYMKLEEKLHAKEAEMNQTQARTQEEVEASIKQLRRGLNFKAKPMPSFYLEAVTRGSDVKKVTVTRSKSPILGKKSPSSLRTVSQGNPTVSTKPSNQKIPTSCEPANTAQLRPLEAIVGPCESEKATPPAENLQKNCRRTPRNRIRPTKELRSRDRDLSGSRKIGMHKERDKGKSNSLGEVKTCNKLENVEKAVKSGVGVVRNGEGKVVEEQVGGSRMDDLVVVAS